MPVFIVFYLLFVGVMALFAQMILPVIFSVTFPAMNVLGVGSALIPLVVIYASLELGDERAPIIAAVLGFLLDLCTHQKLGASILILVGLSTLIASQAQKPEAHHWTFQLVFVLVGTFLYLFLDYLFNLAETERWYWSLDVWTKITLPSLLNLFLSPFFFYLVGLPPRLLGWTPPHEIKERRYAR